VGSWAVAAVAALYALRELFGLPVPLPDRREQVPEWWRRFFGPSATAFLYGLGLGVGFLTYLRHGTLVAVALVVLASGDPVLGASILAAFGVARGLTVLVAAPGTTAEGVGGVMGRLDALAGSSIPRLANGAILVALAGLLAVGAGAATGTPHASLAAEILAAVFAWAAGAKVVGFARWRSTVASYRLPAAAAGAVPLLEAGVPVLVVAGQPMPAAMLSLALLCAFSAAILRARRLIGDRLPCGCFGGRARRSYRLLLARNVGLGVVTLAALADRAGPSTGLLAGQAEFLPVALVMAGAGLVLLMAVELGRLALSRDPSSADR
jgi:hypothetical protein